MKQTLVVMTLIALTWTQTSFGQQVSFEESQNQSDISTFSIPEFHQVNSHIFRGGRPQDGDLELLSQQGVRTIINIDNDPAVAQAEQQEANRLGLKYINSPMSAFSSPNDQQVNQILANLQDSSLFPIFIHCQHGQDRTGLVLGLYRFHVDSWSSQAAYDEMLKYGFHPMLWALDSYYKNQTKY